jgi:hypothetical protein
VTTPTGGTAARRAAREAVATTSSKGKSASKSASPSARRRDLDPDALAALEEERDFLLRSLEDLEREYAAGDVDDSDFEELKDDYTARAAAVIRAIEDRTEAVKSLRPQRNWQRTALGLVLVAWPGTHR